MNLFTTPGGVPHRDPRTGTRTLDGPPSSAPSLDVTTTPIVLGDSAPGVIFAQAGAGTVQLPTEGKSVNKVIWVHNTSGGNLTVNNSAPAAVGAVLANNTSGLFACDGLTWRKLAAVSNA